MIARKRLTQMYQDWQGAKMRLEMAERSFKGAQLDAATKEARFLGAVEFLGGSAASWTFGPDRGISVVSHPTAGARTPSLPAAPSLPPGMADPDVQAAMASAQRMGAEARQTMQVSSTDENGNVRVVTLPTNHAKRKRVLRQMAKQTPSALA